MIWFGRWESHNTPEERKDFNGAFASEKNSETRPADTLYCSSVYASASLSRRKTYSCGDIISVQHQPIHRKKKEAGTSIKERDGHIAGFYVLFAGREIFFLKKKKKKTISHTEWPISVAAVISPPSLGYIKTFRCSPFQQRSLFSDFASAPSNNILNHERLLFGKLSFF